MRALYKLTFFILLSSFFTSSVRAEDISLSLLTEPFADGKPALVNITNTGIRRITISRLVINKKADDVGCTAIPYVDDEPDDLSSPTAVMMSPFLMDKMKAQGLGLQSIPGGVPLTTGEKVPITWTNVGTRCGDVIFVDVETDLGEFNWDLSEQK